MKKWQEPKVKAFIDDNNTKFERVDNPNYDYQLTEGVNPNADGSNVDMCTEKQMLDWDVELLTIC